MNSKEYLNVFLVEPFYSGSHMAWSNNLVKYSKHSIKLITHDGINWRWRMRGSAATLAELIIKKSQTVEPDLFMISSMTNLAELRSLLPKRLANKNFILYMHENQLGYPLSDKQTSSAEFAYKNWLSMLAADKICVNSNFQDRKSVV